jgi:hypothetical protein
MSNLPEKKSKADLVREEREKYMEESKLEGKNIWSGKLSPNEKKALAAAASYYGLDPNMGHLYCMGNKLYVSVDGQRAKAKETDLIQGLQLMSLSKEERSNLIPPVPDDMHAYKCIIAVKGKEKPFIEYGFASKDDVNLQYKHWKNIDDMARTRAIGRCLRNIVPIDLPNIEDMPSMPQDMQVGNIQPVIEVDVEIDDEADEENASEIASTVVSEEKPEPKTPHQPPQVEPKRVKRTNQEIVIDRMKEIFGDSFKQAGQLLRKELFPDIDHAGPLDSSQYRTMINFIREKKRKGMKEWFSQILDSKEEPKQDEISEENEDEDNDFDWDDDEKEEDKNESINVPDETLRIMHENITSKFTTISQYMPGKTRDILKDVTEGQYDTIHEIPKDLCRKVIDRLEIKIAELKQKN